MFGSPGRRIALPWLVSSVLAAGLLATPAARAVSNTPVAFLPFPSGSSIYVSQGNCVNGSTGIPNPTHCDQFGRDAWDFVYARDGRPTDSTGMPVVAARSGTVLYTFDAGAGDLLPSDCVGSGSGNFVIVDDGDGTFTQYLHLQDGSVAVSAGDPILQGDPIGAVGSSGEATGAHLHFSFVTDVDHCGVGLSAPGAFDDPSLPVPTYGQVLTSNNPGPLQGGLITAGGATYVVAGGAPILLPDCVGLYGQLACSQAVSLPDLSGFGAHPVNGTYLLAEPSGLAYRIVGGAPVPIPDCGSFGSCAKDAVVVPDAAISTPDARLSSEPARFSLMRVAGDPLVWEFADGCVRSSNLWFDSRFATIVPSSALTSWPGCPLPTNVDIKRGAVTGSDIIFSLWDQDGDTYDLASSQSSPEASLGVTYTGVPKKLRSLSINVAATASRSCSQTVSMWNWTSSAWNAINVAAVGTSSTVRTALKGKAAPSSYVGGPSGSVKLLVSCGRRKGRFDYRVDWMQVRYTS